MREAGEQGCDVILCDTSGRLHTNWQLMEELAKVERELKKRNTNAPHEVLLVLDGSTGLNMLNQVRAGFVTNSTWWPHVYVASVCGIHAGDTAHPLVPATGCSRVRTALLEARRAGVSMSMVVACYASDAVYTSPHKRMQAKEFSECVGVTGIILTKLDGSSRGGAVVSVVDELGIPVKFVGVGEGVEDLQPFDAGAFVATLFPSGDAIAGAQKAMEDVKL